MNHPSPSLGHQIGERLVRVSITVVGLLVLRGILSVMPMLREDSVWMPNFQQSDVQALIEQYPSYRELIRVMLQAVIDPSRPPIPPGINPNKYAEMKKAWANFLMSHNLAIYPITIARAVVDTLIFALLFLFGFSLASTYRSRYTRLPDLGQMMNLGILTVIVGIAYYSYQGVVFPFLYPDNGAIYGWVFLVLALAPLLVLAVVVARNMDAITALAMHSGGKVIANPGAILCGSCGQTIAAGMKFCPNCGGPMSVAIPGEAGDRKFCPSCGVENPARGKFCRSCGQRMDQ